MKVLMYGLVALLVILIPSCNGTFQVISPKPNQASSQEFTTQGDHINITVKFNGNVDRNTVIPGKTVILVTEREANADGTIQWIDDNTFTFISTKNYRDLLNFDPDGGFSLKLIGSDTGDGAIKDVSGKHLDGDANGSNGGDYKTSFVIVG